MKIQNLVLVPVFALAACATAGSSGGGGKSGAFQGEAAITKRRIEIQDAAKASMDCMKVKPGEQPGKGGAFSVVADASGKLTVDPIMWDGPDAMKQCIVDAGNKTTITPLPGPAVGTLWEFWPPGVKNEQTPPGDLKTAMQSLRATMQAEVVECGVRNLGQDFPADIDVAYFLYKDGKAYAPTVIRSDAKDGSFEQCVREVVSHTKYPSLNVDKPFQTTMHFTIGVHDATHRVRE